MSLPSDPNGGVNSDLKTALKAAFKPAIIGNIQLSDKEDRICKVLVQMTFGNNVAWIARKAGVARTTTAYILNKFVTHKIVHKSRLRKRTIYSFNKGMNRTHIELRDLQKERAKPFQKS